MQEKLATKTIRKECHFEGDERVSEADGNEIELGGE